MPINGSSANDKQKIINLPKEADKLTVGLIGCGERGRILLKAMIPHPVIELRALCDENPQALATAAGEVPEAHQFSDFSHLLLDREFDAVVIATPPASHASLSIEALRAGKHVLCEVPCVTSVEEAEALVKAVHDTGCHYALAENYCFGETVQAVKSFLNQEPLGPYIYCEGSYAEDCREASESIVYNRKTGTTYWRFDHPMCNYATHSLGPLIYLTGHRVTHVVAMMSHRRLKTEYERTIAASMLCYTDQGAVFHSFHSGLCPRRDVHWSLTGERGTIESTHFSLEDHRFLIYRSSGTGVKGDLLRLDLPPSNLFSCYRGLNSLVSERVMLHEFATAILSNKTPEIDVFTALNMSLPGVLGNLSVQSGFKPIEMPVFTLG